MSEKMHHIQLARGDVGRYVLLPGDPGRVPAIAAHLKDARQVSYNREYLTYTGYLEGEMVSVMSTGIGGPSTAIGAEELISIGADTLIRVGTCGGMREDLLLGDVVIATGAIRAEGTSHEYLPAAFPAVPDFAVLRALKDAADFLGIRSHVGVVQCKDSFYGQHAPDSMPVADQLNSLWRAWIAGGCLASEMESAALFILGSARRVRTGSLCMVAGNQIRAAIGHHDQPVSSAEPAIKVAIEAVRRLIRQDAGKSASL